MTETTTAVAIEEEEEEETAQPAKEGEEVQSHADEISDSAYDLF